MKKIRIIIVLVFVVLIIMCCIRFYSKGHNTTYTLGENDEYEIKEIYTKNKSNELDNYYFEIQIGKNSFSFQLFKTFENKRKVIEDIIYYDGDYKCVLPIIDGVAQTDMLCYKDNRYYNYVTVIGNEAKLDQFVGTIDTKIYDKNHYLDTTSNNVVDEFGMKIYDDNIDENHYIAISNLQGVYIINENIKDIEVFKKDIYSRELSAVVGNYYITADYSAKQQFRTFYFVELSTGKKRETKAPNYVSFDSYIQGIVDNKLYIYDKDNEKQYEIDTEEFKVKEVGNSRKKIKYYDNGEWDKITVTKANTEILFDTLVEDTDLDKFDYVYLVGGEKSGYYYIYDYSNNAYRVYRAPVQNKKHITYLFDVQDINDVYYAEEYVYYKDGNKLKSYSDYTGYKTVLEYNELEFNDNLVFGVYKRK